MSERREMKEGKEYVVESRLRKYLPGTLDRRVQYGAWE